MSKDNASQRILSPRRTAQGADDSLRNTLGRTLIDGAQCFVTEEQANYRFLQHSVLHADGRFVVEPVDHSGRWIREPGLCGFALLDGGKLGEAGKPEPLMFRGYNLCKLVQFALEPDGRVLYTGSVPRLGHLAGRSKVEALRITVERPGSDPQFFDGIDGAFGVAILRPGDVLSLRVLAPQLPEAPVSGTLECLLA